MVRTVRPPLDDVEIEGLRPVVDASFGQAPGGKEDPERDAIYRRVFPYHLSTLVLDDSEIIGGCRSVETELSLPGGNSVPALGLSGVGVHPTKTGTGAFRDMMHEHLRMAKNQGSAGSILMASESQLYSRFGYGRSSTGCDYIMGIETPGSLPLLSSHIQPAQPVTMLADLQAEQARNQLDAVYEAARSERAGMVRRSQAWWQVVLYPGKPGWWGGGDQFGVITTDGQGQPSGYALYRLTGDGGPDHGNVNAQLTLHELVANSPSAEMSLWSYLTTVPFVRSVRWRFAPPDTLLRHCLTDARRLEQDAFYDAHWFRPLDVVALMTQRGYRAAGGLRFAIDDQLFPDQSGPWELTVDSTGTATMAPAREADVTLTPGQLGSIVMGSMSAFELHRAGLIKAAEDTVAMMDYLLGVSRQPYCPSKF